MEKRYGSPKRQDGIYKVGRNKYDLFYGFGEDEQGGWNYYQRFTHQPTMAEVKEAIIGQIESEYAEKLRYGLEWNGLAVEYTEERKSDITGILLAMQSGIMELPVTLNLGTDSDGNPIFYEFATADEIISVATAISAHKMAVCNAEWEDKAAIQWSVFTNIQ